MEFVKERRKQNILDLEFVLQLLPPQIQINYVKLIKMAATQQGRDVLPLRITVIYIKVLLLLVDISELMDIVKESVTQRP